MKYISKEDKYGSRSVNVYYDGKTTYVGSFKTLEEAIEGRNSFLTKLKMDSPIEKTIYVNNKDLYYQIYVSKAQGKLTDEACEMLMKIVKGVGKKFFYKNTDDRYDCESYAIENLLRNWYQFDEDKYDNAFAYFTEVIKRGFTMQWNILEKNRKFNISSNGLENYI